MNRNLIIAIIAVLVIGGGYYQFSYKPAQEAAIAAQKAADEAAAAAKAAEEEAAAAAKAAEEEAAAAAKAAEEAAAKLAADAAAALDPAAWDAVKVAAFIDTTALDDATKTTLKAAVTAAGADAAAIGAVVTQIKTALGIQ